MDYVLFLLDLAAGTKQHLRPLIAQKAKCITHQKISLECPAGEQLRSGLRFALLWWPGGGEGQGPVYLSISPGSSRKLSSHHGHPEPFLPAMCPGELHDSQTSPRFQPQPTHPPPKTHRHRLHSHYAPKCFLKYLHICMHMRQACHAHAYLCTHETVLESRQEAFPLSEHSGA